jgi:ubiquitin-protein ligase
MSNNAVKRIISKDIKELKNLKLEEQGIYIEFDEDNILEAKAIIIGPKNTPYENGILYFRIKFPKNYPFAPPVVKYYSYSKIRIHPNLYVGLPSDNFLGKVCVSIINTWSGPKWTTVMHIGSVLLSLMSLLDENPLRNEPGYENIKGKYNDIYNTIVEYDKFKHLILNNGFEYGEYEIFKDVIKEHLRNNKEEIMCKVEELSKQYRKTRVIRTNIYGITKVDINYDELKIKLKNKFDSDNI